MKKFFSIAVAIFLLIAVPTAIAQQQSATVISVGDGDTIRVRSANQTVTVRLGCIDAPEISQQPWGERARYRLGQFLPTGQAVRLRFIDRDQYGRTVAEVLKGNQSVNLQMVREGYAIIYPQYFSGCNASRGEYQQAEAGARQNRLAFWSQPSPIMPWDFRAGRRTPQQPVARPTTAPTTQTAATPLREPTRGQGCQCPYDIDRRGNACGGRSAYSRPGGEEPKCYVGD
ncbi:thermonuclease family protein [Phormidium sp. LEGE 05292]|uniref:thermonuclease family protein n=1 Tax=[Phormidium] sp. LEGE 05292 TaxID=767427 RepID=UPI001882888D|nr:thermonuclease family protein [Phormidium sp. LEGE 05292]MBE9224040.1 thermonuclease family protein [Phormidium sp. LEGE 05292]